MTADEHSMCMHFAASPAHKPCGNLWHLICWALGDRFVFQPAWMISSRERHAELADLPQRLELGI